MNTSILNHLALGLTIRQNIMAVLLLLGVVHAQAQSVGGIVIQPPPFPPTPTVTVSRTDYAQTTRWSIRWSGGTIETGNNHHLREVFSTITGAVNSTAFLNNTGPAATANADMLLWGYLRATSESPFLDYEDHLRDTLFRMSTWTPAMLTDATANNPGAFAFGFEWGFFGPAVTETPPYEQGDIYLFKTDRAVPKYGAVEIRKWGGAGDTVINVVVRK